MGLVNCYEDHDIEFLVQDHNAYRQIFANRSLVLYRAVEREVDVSHRYTLNAIKKNTSLKDCLADVKCPCFLREVYNAKGRQMII